MLTNHKHVGFSLQVLLATALLANTASAHPGVDAARAAYEEGDFSTALFRLKEVERDPKLTDADLVQVYWVRASSQMAMGRRKDADASFDRLLAIQPLYEPSTVDASPAVLAALNRRREVYNRNHGVAFGTPTWTPPDVQIELTRNAARVGSMTIFARASGDTAFKQYSLPAKEGKIEGRVEDLALWEQACRTGKLEVALEARNERGAALARQGDAQTPLEVSLDQAACANAISVLQPPPPANPEPTPTVDPNANTPTQPVAPVAEPTPSPLVTFPWGAILGGVFGVGTAGLLVLSLVSAAISTASYAGTWLHPVEVGAESSFSYRGLFYGWLGTMGAGGVMALLAGGTGLAAVVSLAAWLILKLALG